MRDKRSLLRLFSILTRAIKKQKRFLFSSGLMSAVISSFKTSSYELD